MEHSSEEIKKIIKTTLKAVFIPILIPIMIVLIVIIILSASVYFVTVDDGTYKEDDWSSTPYASGEYTQNLKITADGHMSSNYTAQQIWDKMKDNGGRVNQYLNGPKELAQMMYAEMVTQLPDLREDTSKIRTMEEWKETFDNLQEEEAKYDTFQASETKKEGQFTKFDLSDEELRGMAGICVAEQGSAIGAAAEASLIANKYDISGATGSIATYVLNSGWWAGASKQNYYNKNGVTDEVVAAVRGVLVEGKRTLPKYVDEHDYRGDIASATNDGVPIDIYDNSQYIPHKTIIKNNMGSTYTFYCFPTEQSDPFGYISEERRQEYGDDCYGGSSTTTTQEETGYKNNLQGGIIRLTRNLVTGTSDVTEAEFKKMETDYDNYKDDYKIKEEEREKKKEKEEKEKEEKEKEKEEKEKEEKEKEEKEKEEKEKEEKEKEEKEEDNKEDDDKEDDDKEDDDKEDEKEEEIKPLLEFEEWMKQKGYTKEGDKWKRNGSKISMTYLSPEEFKKKIDAYKTAKTDKEREKAREEVLKHFTLEKGSASSSKKKTKSESLDGYIYIGDSITEGLSKANLNEENTKIMQNVKYHAVIGVAAKYWLDNFGQFESADEVKGVCVMLGTNAVGDISNMQNLIQKLSEKYSGVNVYVEKILPVGRAYSYGASPASMNESINRYNSEIQEYCNQFDNVFFIDTTDGYVGDDGYLKNEVVEPDGLHLKMTQYDKLIENLSSQICQGSSDGEPLSSMDGVLFVGDSITNCIPTSILPSSPELQEKLKNCEYRAYPGQDINYTLRQIDTFPSDSKVKALCVMMGTNQPTGQEQMKTFIEKMLERYPDKPIYVQKTFPRGKGSTGFVYSAEDHNELLKKYNKDIEEYCSSKENVYFIDATDGYVQSDGYLDSSKAPQDGVHLYGENGIQWVENIIEKMTGNGEGNSGGASLEELLNSEPDLKNEEYYKHYGNDGYCQWYALSRSREIYGVDFDVDPGLSGSPHRNNPTFQDWLVDKYPEYFKKSNEPEAGSIYCVTGDSVGHVGFIRSLDKDTGKMIIEDGNSAQWQGTIKYYNWVDYGITTRDNPGLCVHETTLDQFYSNWGRKWQCRILCSNRQIISICWCNKT